MDVQLNKTSGHCWLVPNVILYDRPNMTWVNNQFHQAGLVLTGNMDSEVEGKELRGKGINMKPWIFWPRRPYVVETHLKENEMKKYGDRDIDSIFIGNIENNIQGKFT